MSDTHILVVDDDKNLSTTMNMILTRKGYATDIAENGEMAIEKVKNNKYDILLMDIKMPGIDGVETFKRIKDIDRDVIVIMTTAYAVEDKINAAVKEGAFGVMYKPLDIDQILEIIEDFEGNAKRESILIIDDEREIANLIMRIMNKNGYETEYVDSGVKALKLVQEKKHDIYIIDIVMPEISGYDTYLGLKELNPDAVYVFMTGYYFDQQEIVGKAISSGAFSCLKKPFQLIDVMTTVKHAMQLKGA